MCPINIIIILITYIHLFIGVNSDPDKRVGFLWDTEYQDCEGKDRGNYSLIAVDSRDLNCDRNGHSLLKEKSSHILIQRLPDHTKSVNNLVKLAGSRYPAGAYTQSENVYLIISGTLEGKYLYDRRTYLDQSYTKLCSSVLGLSYVTTKSSVLLIADTLPLEVLISPVGAYEPFKRLCNTQCRGQGWITGSQIS